MIKQIKELTDNTEHVKSLLASYNFEQNETGLPIDAVGFGDYSRYIAAFKYLLYQKNEAFYAGQPIYEDETGQKYVPGLATFVLLATIGRMDVLDAFQKDIVIPESYISDSNQKIEIYQDIALCKDEKDIQDVIDELIDRFGDIPHEVENLLEISRIKQLAKTKGVSQKQ